ncbi:thermonuclease family protein [Nitrobacter winogradskyi]|uniref:Uncharacterized protein n=1 Tax=Nitrobacter winogradskyi TaxID=913 RepID=A0ACC6AEH2_NITWI|nr:hypothetical protein [Nitrobacter winogradskyi]
MNSGLKRLLIAAIVTLAFSPALAETITGQASVIDGDTLEIHGQRIRLSGVDAPESDQLCRGDDSLQYRCGAKAANELARFNAGRSVSCKGVDVDRYKRVVAVCSVGGVNLGKCHYRTPFVGRPYDSQPRKAPMASYEHALLLEARARWPLNPLIGVCQGKVGSGYRKPNYFRNLLAFCRESLRACFLSRKTLKKYLLGDRYD